MLDSFEWPEPEDEPDKVLLRNVRNHGCHVMGIAGDEREAGYVFSIGLYLNYGQPELILFGLDPNDGCAILKEVRDCMAAGRQFAAGDVCDGLLDDRRVCFVEVPLGAYRDHLGTTIWFYAKLPRPFPCLQIVWPDRAGRFPWEAGCDTSLSKHQPVLWSVS